MSRGLGDVYKRQLLCRLLAEPCKVPVLAQELGLSPPTVLATLQELQAAGISLRPTPDGHWVITGALDLLDSDVILAGLSEQARALLGNFEVLWRVDSTNAQLLSSSDGGPGIDVLMAEGQDEGRGRHGRKWVSPLCNHIYMSLDCPFPQGVSAMSGLSIAVGVMVVRALEELGMVGVGLKWPNDLFTADGKLGGILIESSGSMKGPAHAVVGIGLNVHAPPELVARLRIDQPWDWLDRAAGRIKRRNIVTIALLNALLPGLKLFREEGLKPFLADYAQRDVLKGRMIWIEDGHGGRLPATALGLAQDGSLRIRDGGTERCIHAGEVSVRMQ